MTESWKLVGYDSFDETYYSLSGVFPNETEARQSAVLRLRSLEITQPSDNSGGQGEFGIQDRVFIERPNGTRYRFIPLPEELEK